MIFFFRVGGGSAVWKFFAKEGKTQAKCQIKGCNSIVATANNTSNLWTHLERHHKSFYNAHINGHPQEDVSEELNDENENPPKKKQKVGTLCNYFSPLGTYPRDSQRKKEIDFHLLRLMTVDLQPFSIVEDSAFQDFTRVLDCRYKLPSRTYVREVLLEKYYQKTFEEVKAAMEHVK